MNLSPEKNRLLVGDCRAMLRTLKAGTIQVCATSPPYYGLRAYQTAPQVWGGAPECEHVWGEDLPASRARWGDVDTLSEKQASNHGSAQMVATLERSGGNFCQRCSGWRGELGGEPHPDLFVAHLVEVFREVRRVLRPDGVLFVNLGDSYATGAGAVGNCPGGGAQGERWKGPTTQPNRMPMAGLKPKDMCLVPQRFALAMQADGWWCRSECIWWKPNGMCSSVDDRPTLSHETVWMFTQAERYFWDGFAVRKPYAKSTLPQQGTRYAGEGLKAYEEHQAQNPSDVKRRAIASMEERGGANLRSVWRADPDDLEDVWEINTVASNIPHYAMMAPDVARLCVKAASSEKGRCPHCRAPWERVTEKSGGTWEKRKQDGHPQRYGVVSTKGMPSYPEGSFGEVSVTSIDWRPTCTCPPHDPEPCLVLDPFAGVCTTGVVALQEGREFVGCELSDESAQWGEKRLAVEGKRAWRRMKITRPVPGQGALLDL